MSQYLCVPIPPGCEPIDESYFNILIRNGGLSEEEAAKWRAVAVESDKPLIPISLE